MLTQSRLPGGGEDGVVDRVVDGAGRNDEAPRGRVREEHRSEGGGREGKGGAAPEHAEALQQKGARQLQGNHARALPRRDEAQRLPALLRAHEGSVFSGEAAVHLVCARGCSSAGAR